jgi:hypothetical protein
MARRRLLTDSVEISTDCSRADRHSNGALIDIPGSRCAQFAFVVELDAIARPLAKPSGAILRFAAQSAVRVEKSPNRISANVGSAH